MIYPINPVPKPRQTRSDKWKKRPGVLRYRAFKDLCRLHKVELPECGAGITFLIKMPESWSQKKKETMNMQAHQQTPDLDNLLKALCDAVYKNDSHIWHYNELEKLWSWEGAIIIVSG